MKLQTLFALTTLTLPILSHPLTPPTAHLSRRQLQTAIIPWQVTSYQSGCSPGGCSYTFQITSQNSTATFTGEPKFSTQCKGIESVLASDATSNTGKLVACVDDGHVWTSQVYNGTSRMIIVSVEHDFVVAVGDAAQGTTNASVKSLGSWTYSVDGDKPVGFPVAVEQISAVA